MFSHTDAPAVNGATAGTPGAARYCADCGAPDPRPGPGHPCPGAPRAAPDPAQLEARPGAQSERQYEAQMSSVRDALALYFSILAVLGAASVVALVMPIVTPEQDAALDLTASAAMTAVVAIAAIFARRRLAPALTTLGKLRWYALAPVAGLGTFALASVLCDLAARYFDVPFAEATASMRAAGFPWAVAVVVLCIQPAIFEELAFRGVMTASLEPALGPRPTIILTAFLFAIIHLNPISLVHLLVIGLTLGVVRRVSGSLYPCILLHLCHNGLCLLEEALR